MLSKRDFQQQQQFFFFNEKDTKMPTLTCCSTQFDSESKNPHIIVAELKYILLSDNGILQTMAA